MSYDIITIKEFKALEDGVNGLFEILYDNNEVYKGKIVNNERHGYGVMYKTDTGEAIYDGIWVNDKPIDKIDLPVITHLNIKTLPCEHITFNYKNFKPNTNNIINEVDLAYYVPFGGGYDLYAVKAKAIAQSGLSFKNNKIEVTVTNSICNNLENLGQCINVANDINKISDYILKLDEDCSNCSNFNRSWVCCGQFAPFLYIYVFLLFGNINDFIKKHNFNKEKKDRIPSYINDVTTVFYKIFTSYGIDDAQYHDTINDIGLNYDVSIPTVFDNNNFSLAAEEKPFDWFLPHKNEYSITDFKDNTPYLITLNFKENPRQLEVTHYLFMYKYNNYIIINDSWSHSPIGQRYPVTRIMEIDMFISLLNKLNKSYEIINSIFNSNNISDSDSDFIRNSLFEVPYNGSNPQVIKLIQEFLLYNFIIDALFLVPYYKKSIDTNIQPFIINDISQIRIVNPYAVFKVFSILSNASKKISNNPDGNPFEEYLRMGGSRNVSKIGIKKKKTRRKVNINKKQSKKKKYLKRKK